MGGHRRATACPCPAALYAGAGSELFVGDQNNDRVQVFDLDGNYLRCFGSGGGMSFGKRFGRITGITGDALGRLEDRGRRAGRMQPASTERFAGFATCPTRLHCCACCCSMPSTTAVCATRCSRPEPAALRRCRRWPCSRDCATPGRGCRGSPTSCVGGFSTGRGPPGPSTSPRPAAGPVAESAAEYALCYKCHDRNSILNDESFKEHDKHIRGVKAPCSVCHDPHAATQSGSHSGTHLINFRTDVVAPNMNGLLYFRDDGTFRGACYLKCHNVNHNPKGY